ncbi:uncharacterized protein LOC135683342 [Rhopilema esculentum]|uniref:uncharacterized protein LOC135683342 n=1 Tax=Rhopilema esculentum TaxID=499914 RepID=UPI0031D4C401|eukprot:gene5479-652_t
MKCQAIYPVGTSRNGGSAIGITICIITSLFNVMSNSTLVYSLVKLKLLHKATFIFYFFMTLSDLLIAAFLQPMVSYIETVSKQSCTITDIVGQFLALTLCEFSGLMITLVAIDRYYQIVLVQNYVTFMSKSKALVLVLLAAIICTIVGTVSVIASFWLFIYEFLLFLSVSNAMILLTVCITYLKGYRELHSRVTASNRAIEIRIARHIAALLVAMSVCYIPTFAAQPLWVYSKYKAKHGPSTTVTLFVSSVAPLVIVNSILNTIILNKTAILCLT